MYLADFIVLVLLSLLITAAVAYLPNHLIVISNRLWYYVQGETLDLTSTKSRSVLNTARSVLSAPSTGTARKTAEEVVRQMHEL